MPDKSDTAAPAGDQSVWIDLTGVVGDKISHHKHECHMPENAATKATVLSQDLTTFIVSFSAMELFPFSDKFAWIGIVRCQSMGIWPSGRFCSAASSQISHFFSRDRPHSDRTRNSFPGQKNSLRPAKILDAASLNFQEMTPTGLEPVLPA